MANKVADIKTRDNGRFDPDLKDADQGFFFTKLLNADAMRDFVKGASERATSNECIRLAADIANLPQELNPLNNLEAFEDAVHRNRDMSLAGIIFGKLLLPDLMKAGFAAAITSGLGVVTPLFTKQIIGYVDTTNPTPQEQSSAYGFGGAWVGTHGAKIFSKEYVGKVMFQQALKAQQILNVEIIRKITRLKPQDRKVYQNGDELKILAERVSDVFNFVRACSVFIASPTKLVAVQVLVFKEIGYLGLVLIGVISIVAVAQVLISKKLTIANKIKREAAVQRSEFNQSSFASIKLIRQLGWEEYILKKNAEIRERENNATQYYYSFQSFSSTLAHMAPTVIVLIILLVQALTSYQADFTIAKIYTVLAYVGMSYSPVRNFFEAIFQAIEGFAALKMIDVLLKLQEAEEVDQMDKELQRGEVLCRRGYLGTFEEDQERLAYMPDLEIPREDSIQIKVFNRRKNVSSEQDQSSQQLTIKKNKFSPASLTLLSGFQIKQGDHYIILGHAPKDRKAFLYAIMGKLKTVEGKIRYGGKFGYVPDDPWLKKDTIKENILFGLKDDPVKLKNVYDLTKLDEEIKKLSKQEETIVLEDLSNLTSVQTMKIMIARTLYMEPDIILFENTFDWFQKDDIAKAIFNNICKKYPKMTIIQTTFPKQLNIANRNISEPRLIKQMLCVDDEKEKHTFIMLIEKGVVKKLESYSKVSNNIKSEIHKFLKPDKLEPQKKTGKGHNLQEPELDIQQIDQERNQMQAVQRINRIEELRYRARKFVKYLLKFTDGMTQDEIAERLLDAANMRRRPTNQKTKRIRGVPFAVYATLFRSVGYTPYFLLSNNLSYLVMLIIFAETVKIFSDWWLGTIKSLPWQIPQAHAVYIFIGLSMGFSLLSLAIGLAGPKISRNSADTLSKKVCYVLAKSRMSWFEGKNVSEIAKKINLNTEEIFKLNILARNLIRNILLFIATMVLVGINNPSYAGIAVAITVVAIIIMYFYIRQEREAVELGRLFKEPVEKAYEDAVQGTEAMKAVNQLDSYRYSVVMPIYRKQAHASYDKNINHGMAILTKLTSMIGVTGTAFLSVGSNTPTSSFDGDPAITGTSITFTQKLNEIMVNISRDFKSLELGLRESVFNAILAVDKDQIDPNGSDQLANQPINNTVRFMSVTIEEPDHSLPVLINETFEFPAGKKSMICGMTGGRAILMAISRQLQPENGRIKIGNLDIKTIKPSGMFILMVELAKIVMMMDEEPFFFNGTIKENLTPKDWTINSEDNEDQKKKKEEQKNECYKQLKKKLQMVGIWDSLTTKQSKPKHIHDVQESDEDAFSALSFSYPNSTTNALDAQIKQDKQMHQKLDYKITDVKKQLSGGIRQRLNIVRALILKPKVLLCHNHLSYLRDKTAADLNRLLMDELKDTTIIYYVPNPNPKKPMAGIDKVFYSRRGEICDMGEVEPQNQSSKAYYDPLLKNVQPRQQSEKKTTRQIFASLLKTFKAPLYDQLQKYLKQPVKDILRNPNNQGTIWDRVKKMKEQDYGFYRGHAAQKKRRPVSAGQQLPREVPRRKALSGHRENYKTNKKDSDSWCNSEMAFEQHPVSL